MERPRPTVFDVARLAGVSKSTVSRVLNDRPDVAAKSRGAVLEAIAKLGYRRNDIARSLRTRSTMLVGYVVTSLLNEAYSAIGHGITTALSATDRTLVIGSSGDTRRGELLVVRKLLQRGVDGLIMSLGDERDRAIKTELNRADVPVVFIDRDAGEVDADRILRDHRHAIQSVIAELNARGHSAIGLLSHPDITRPGREVGNAFAAASGTPGLIRSGPLTEESGAARMLDLIQAEPRLTAVIVCGPQAQVGALSLLRSRGIRVPDDIYFIAYDDSAVARLHDPPLTAFANDFTYLGEEAARLLIERVDGHRRHTRTVALDVRLIERTPIAAPASHRK